MKKKQGRIHCETDADGWVGAVMINARNSKQFGMDKRTDGPNDTRVELRVRG